MTTTMLQATQISHNDMKKVVSLAAHLENEHLAAVLMHLVGAVERGTDVAFLDADKELSPNKVAEILKVSRPFVVKLMDRDLLAYRTVGKHRRVAMADLIDYMQRNERANAHVSQLIATREHSVAEAMDQAAVLTDDDLAELASLDGE